MNEESRADIGAFGVCQAAVEASRLVGIRAWNVPSLSVLLGMHSEVLSAVGYRSLLVNTQAVHLPLN